ncbi:MULTISPECIES: type III pantothenate kinase [Aliiglaciecola]|uniref:type III pantothenate kinase n=1 Tax=Aliiglaciecola TaxID=1406885 RepID=UPI001C08CF54|nr:MULTISPECIES: type III pantothenate kinase [unclassified Aliiglaciecola]MBU2876096.1 type III pantothenate kinase [Aliiglaciecola lipolytica]MDO6713297.1 type III pantothenate kinase [Aliiglaciecola sp. 2_MG-2023]MDO6754444.1 type III pantothenate kinase [Aliiglaciecola sp. 1_MG-2023]
MSGLHDILLIDVGNSRIKYAQIASADSKVVTQVCDSIEDLQYQISSAQCVIAASVQNDQVTLKIKQLCHLHNIPFQQVVTQATAFGISCAYQQFQTLGVDRWLAVLGARLHTQLPVAILDLGTAATCDVLVGEQHLGGWIAPGFQLMRKAVTSQTSKVFADQQTPDALSLGKSTPDCVNMGGLAMLEGFLYSARKRISGYSDDYRIFLCGGDSELLKNIIDEKVQFKPDLVLQGLSRFIPSK